MRRALLSLVMTTLFLSCHQQAPESNSLPTTIDVTGGTIEGALDSLSGVVSYKGIPFAAPPVGNLRWKAPQPVEPWEGVMQCKDFGPSPMQTPPRPFMFWSSEFLIPQEPISEDCLYLNVWTNAKELTDKLPVLVYIYGGGFVSGGAGCPIYDGTAMAKKDVVFVTINYRVGRFGFFAHPALTQESGYGASGNYAVLDMIAALKWVRDNVGQFGGDAGNVTIAGQSAGATGVNILCASPLAKGLFHKAIGQSGANFYQRTPGWKMSLEEAEELGQSFAESLGAASLERLRAVPADSILYANGPNWPFFTDGYVLQEPIAATYKAGLQNDVALLVGWNEDDVVTLPARNQQGYEARVTQGFGEIAARALQVYPASNDAQAATVSLEMNRDEIFAMQMYGWAKHQRQTGKKPVYVYNFNRALPARSSETEFGAFHSGEVVYAYDNLHTLNRPWEPADHRIAAAMSSYWANFAKMGDPNGDDLPQWPPFTRAQKGVLVIDEETKAVALPFAEDKLQFWESFFESQPENM